MYYGWPTDPKKIAPLMSRFMRENISVETNIQASRRRPQPPRGLQITWTDPHFDVTWLGPQNMSAILGFNIYRDNENNRIQNLANAQNLFTSVVMPTGFSGPAAFWVSCYTTLLESIKVPIIGNA